MVFGRKPLENRVYWRNNIIDRVNSNDSQLARKTSESIIEHLVAYSKENKIVSREGYNALQQNWNSIIKNAKDLDRADLLTAETYLSGEHLRLEGKTLDNKTKKIIIKNSEPFEENIFEYDSFEDEDTPLVEIDTKELNNKTYNFSIPTKKSLRKGFRKFGNRLVKIASLW